MIFGKEKIELVAAREILDSRGNPTIEVEIHSQHHKAAASVPSGASTGIYEALALRDGDPGRFNGKGVKKSVQAINELVAPKLIGANPLNQKEIDDLLINLDGTKNKSKLGANATLGISLAVARLSSLIVKQPLFRYLNQLADIKPSRKLPYLYANLINGGKHAATTLPFQEYHAIPQTDSLEEALNIIYKIQSELKKTLKANIGDEGGFVANFSDVEEPLKYLQDAAEKSGASKIKFALDVAASSFYENGSYNLYGQKITVERLSEIYQKLSEKYPLLSIEDPFYEEEFEEFAKLKSSLANTLIVGDDLTTTNPERIQKAVQKNSIGAIIIKPNQIGTLSETLTAMKLSRDNQIECVVSHRSGETNDDFIADLALAFGTFGIKAGALQRGERVAKYNRLLAIAR